MKHRKLRIAWSVAWGTVAVLLIGLWVRSYWWADTVFVPLTDRHNAVIASVLGGVSFSPWMPPAFGNYSSQLFRSEKYGELPALLKNSRVPRETHTRIAEHEGVWALYKSHPPIRIGILNHGATIRSPYFVLMGCAIGFGVLSWCRFSLRTLLIATTLVAVGLGLIVWLR